MRRLANQPKPCRNAPVWASLAPGGPMSDLFNDTLGPQLIAREGGDKFTNNPNDPGGATKFGVTAKVLGQWRRLGRDATAAEVQALEYPEALALYRASYWTSPGYEAIAQVSEPIAEELFDAGVNMGPQSSGKFLQRLLNVLNRRGQDWPDIGVDGNVGNFTRSSLAAFLAKRGKAGEQVLLFALKGMRCYRYVELAELNGKNEDFENGWLARAAGVQL